MILFALGCAELHVNTDYRHTVDFANDHTASWDKVNASNSLWVDRIKRDVDSELEEKVSRLG